MLPPYANINHIYDDTIELLELHREDSTLMSIAIAIIGKDGIVLATDSCLTSQYPFEDGGTYPQHQNDFVKLWNVNNALGIAGVSNYAGYESRIVEIFQQVCKTQTYNELIEEFRTCMRDDISQSFTLNLTVKEQRDMALKLLKDQVDIILAGYNNGIPQLKHISWNLTTAKELPIRNICGHYYIAGVPNIAHYWVRKVEKDLPSMNIRQLKRFITFLIIESTYFKTIKEPIQMLTIEREIGVKSIDNGEIDRMVKEIKTIRDDNFGLLFNYVLNKQE